MPEQNKKLELVIMVNNLINVVTVRLTGINKEIAKVRKTKISNLNTHILIRDEIEKLRFARSVTSKIISDLKNLITKGYFTHEEFVVIKERFMNLKPPNRKKEESNDDHLL
jgi:hypothetical protein